MTARRETLLALFRNKLGVRAKTSAHLSAIDVADRRRGKLLSLAGALAFNLLAVAVLFIVWLWWRAYI